MINQSDMHNEILYHAVSSTEDSLGPLHGTTTSTFEDDDPSKEKEAEMMLEYIEKFNELLEDKAYEEAAVHAANSPKGILRTPETLVRFKGNKVDFLS